MRGSYLLEGRNHDIWAVVDREDDISDTSSSQALDLVEDHRTVGKLDQWLGESESLSFQVSFWSCSSRAIGGGSPLSVSVFGRGRALSICHVPMV